MRNYTDIIHDHWPEWVIEEEIGRGSYGRVFRARRDSLSGTSRAAIKVILIPGEEKNSGADDYSAGDPTVLTEAYLREAVQNLAEEISLMEQVKGHTNVVNIEDFVIEELPDRKSWMFLIRMELLTPLGQYMAEHPMTEADIIRLGQDICTALTVCRANRIVHRDIKPANICVNRTGDFKLGDFGEAKALEPLSLQLSRRGTPNYMAPELYRHTAKATSAEEGAQIDIYSLGLVLYWLANRQKLPFWPEGQLTPGAGMEAFQRRIGGELIPPPSQASPALRRVILKACAYRPEDRYRTAEEMKADLARAAGGMAEGEAGNAGRKGRRRALIWAAAALALLLAGAGIYLAATGRKDPGGENAPAETTTVPAEEEDGSIYDAFKKYILDKDTENGQTEP